MAICKSFASNFITSVTDPKTLRSSASFASPPFLGSPFLNSVNFELLTLSPWLHPLDESRGTSLLLIKNARII